LTARRHARAGLVDSHPSRGLLRPDAFVAVRCAVIDAEKATYPILLMCRLLRVPRSTFYAWRRQADTATTVTVVRRRELVGHVQRVFDASRGTYGCRWVAAALNRDSIAYSVGPVINGRRVDARTRPESQPAARAYKRTTLPGQQPADSPDLIGRDFTPARPGIRLVGDITYLGTGEGWLNLVAPSHRHRPGHPHGGRLADRRPPAHQRGRRRPGHGPTGTATSPLARCSTPTGAIHLGRVHRVPRPYERPTQRPLRETDTLRH
jgi:putative transposase